MVFMGEARCLTTSGDIPMTKYAAELLEVTSFLKTNLSGFTAISKPTECLSTVMQKFTFTLEGYAERKGAIKINESTLEIVFDIFESIIDKEPCLRIDLDGNQATCQNLFNESHVNELDQMSRTLKSTLIEIGLRQSPNKRNSSPAVPESPAVGVEMGLKMSKSTVAITEGVSGSDTLKTTVITDDPQLIMEIQQLVAARAA